MPKVPLKQKTVDEPEVQEIITTGVNNEYKYLAYLAGLELETASGTYSESVLGSLGKTNQSLDLSIGTFTNTGRESGDVGDQGTDGSGDLAITTTNTTIYQQDATYSEPSNFRHPLYQHEVSNRIRIQEFNDADQLELGEELAKIIYAGNYPGTFHLGSSAPSSDYAIAVANVMTDTRADDTSTVYNIYQRKIMTTNTPTTMDRGLMAVARGTSSPFNAKTGTYKGLIVMSDAHRKETVKACLDRYLSTITGSVKPIGSYLIRTSTPSETGTWVAKGTAVDTRNIVEQENTTTSYTSINSNTHWQVTASTPQDFLTDGIFIKVGGTFVYNNTNGPFNNFQNTTTITANGKTYTRGSTVSGAPSGSQWYTFTETSTAQTDEIKSGTTNITTYTLYVRTV